MGKYRLVFERAPGAMVLVDREGRIALANEQAEKLFGYARRELLGRPVEILVRPWFRGRSSDLRGEDFRELQARALEAGGGFSGLRKDGTVFPAEIGLNPIEAGQGGLILAAIADITERRRAEQALQNSENSLAMSQRIARLGSWTIDLATGEFALSEEMYRICGVSPAAFAHTLQSFIGLIHPDDRPAMPAWVIATLSGKKPGGFEFRISLPEGGIRFLQGEGALQADSRGKPTLLVGTAQDITERKKAQAALIESEARYRSLFESSADGILIADIETGTVRYANPAVCRMFGYTEDEFRALGASELHPKEARSSVLAECAALLRGGKTSAPNIPCVRKDGTVFYADVSASTIVVDGRPCHMSLFRDGTERLRLQAQFLQAQKMEAVGRLAGGVAHDFNNLLTAILGYSQLVLQGMDPDDPNRLDIESISKAGRSAAGLTRQLLAFSRQQVLEPRLLNVNDVLRETEKMLQRLIGEDIELVLRLAEDLATVKADPGQIEQVVMNLAINSRDAMPEGGRITIETKNAEFGPDDSKLHQVAPGPYVVLSVGDDGCGMDQATLARVFEPFFTTKEKGKGTGLGLATVYGIVKQSGGGVLVESEPDRGTTFRVCLPLLRESPEPLDSRAQEGPSGGTETVLLVDDDETVRHFTGRVLRQLGYTVLDAKDPKEALVFCVKSGTEIRLLLTDLVMPQMHGTKLAEHVRAKVPGVKVVFMTGYIDADAVRQGVFSADAPLLQKPMTIGALARKVRETLDGGGPRP